MIFFLPPKVSLQPFWVALLSLPRPGASKNTLASPLSQNKHKRDKLSLEAHLDIQKMGGSDSNLFKVSKMVFVVVCTISHLLLVF